MDRPEHKYGSFTYQPEPESFFSALFPASLMCLNLIGPIFEPYQRETTRSALWIPFSSKVLSSAPCLPSSSEPSCTVPSLVVNLYASTLWLALTTFGNLRQSQNFDDWLSDLSVGIHRCGVGREPVSIVPDLITWTCWNVNGFSWNYFLPCGGSHLFPIDTAAPSEDEFVPFQLSFNILCLVFLLYFEEFLPCFSNLFRLVTGNSDRQLFFSFDFLILLMAVSLFISLANCTQTGLGYFLFYLSPPFCTARWFVGRLHSLLLYPFHVWKISDDLQLWSFF